MSTFKRSVESHMIAAIFLGFFAIGLFGSIISYWFATGN